MKMPLRIVVGGSLGVPVVGEAGQQPREICIRAREEAAQRGLSPLILDTAGRLHIDDEMLDTFTIVTTPDALGGEVKARYGGLVDRITVGWWRKDWWPAVEEVLRAL